METLDDLRRRIDTIDQDILRKLEERTKIVEEVGHRKAKNGSNKSFMRPGREASMLRNLVQNIGGKFPRAGVAAIWRTIIASSLSIEQEMRIAAYRTAGQESCYWLAREYFGAFTPIELRYEVEQVIEAVEEGAVAAGVLPMPWHDNDSNRWWLELRKTGLKIFARIPFVENSETQQTDKAIAIANVLPEPTGDDTTLLCLSIPANVTDKHVVQAMNDAGLEVIKLCTAMENDEVALLIYIKGFYTEESKEIQLITMGTPIILGAYANPIEL